jgi:hypothetical protein
MIVPLKPITAFAVLRATNGEVCGIAFWLVCFSDTVKGPMRQMYFVVLLPDGTVVVPRVEKQL